MSLGFTFFLMASLLSDRFSGFGIWDSGATTSMSGFTSAMEDSFWINKTPRKQVSCTFANGESQTINSITSQITVGLHFSCFWTHSCVWMLCELWAGCRGEAKPTHDDFRCICLPRRCRVDTSLGTCASHQACDLVKWTVRAAAQSRPSMFITCASHQLRRYLNSRYCLPFLRARGAQAMSL